MSLYQDAETIFKKTIDQIRPENILPGVIRFNKDTNTLTVENVTIELKQDRPLYVIGFGKASATMAEYIESLLGNRIADGLVITSPQNYKKLSRIQIFSGSHPLPDKKSLSSTYELLTFISSIPKNAVVINLVSGGASSLLCMPNDKIEVEDLQEASSLLIESGASIHEINTVRKALSKVKGGQLLDYLRYTSLIDLVISDVPDNDLSMIGSGPTIAQKVSAHEAFKVLKKYNLYGNVSHDIRSLLAVEMDKEVKNENVTETKDFDRHHSFIISSARDMAEIATSISKELGYSTQLENKAWDGDIEPFVEKICSNIPKSDSSNELSAFIFYGECTINVSGDGLGGRNQELALRVAKQIDGHRQNIAFLSAGTDGIDGPTDAAGAVVTQKTISEAKDQNVDAEEYLSENDSYHFFQNTGGHIKTGATGNNVMDLQILLIE